MNFLSIRNVLLQLLLLLTNVHKLLAERKGSLTCHSGSRIPGNYHGDVDGTLEYGNFAVKLNNMEMSHSQRNLISADTYTLTLERLSDDFMGFYMRASESSDSYYSVDASGVIAEHPGDDTGDVTAGPYWYVGSKKVSCPNGVSGATQTDDNDKTLIDVQFDVSKVDVGSVIDVEITAMTSSVRRYYYSNLQFEIVSNGDDGNNTGDNSIGETTNAPQSSPVASPPTSLSSPTFTVPVNDFSEDEDGNSDHMLDNKDNSSSSANAATSGNESEHLSTTHLTSFQSTFIAIGSVALCFCAYLFYDNWKVQKQVCQVEDETEHSNHRFYV